MRLLPPLLLVVGCGSYGSGPEPLAKVRSPSVTDAAEQSEQDQQILLEALPFIPGPLIETTKASHLEEPAAVASASPIVKPLHTAEDLRRVARMGVSELKACVEAVGLLEGELVLRLELDHKGIVLGGSTSPPGGEEGIAAVADCLLLRARAWTFPSRTQKGHTVVIIPYWLGSSIERSDL